MPDIFIEADPENPICDFCSNPHPTWEFNVEPGKRIGEDRVRGRDISSMDFDGRWAACETCKLFILHRENSKLADHSADNFFQLYPIIPRTAETRRDVLARVRQAHNFFFTLWDGSDPKPVQP